MCAELGSAADEVSSLLCFVRLPIVSCCTNEEYVLFLQCKTFVDAYMPLIFEELVSLVVS